MDENTENFVNAALKLAEADNLTQLGPDPMWEEVDHDTLVLLLRVQSAVLRERTVKLDGWTEAMRLISELATAAGRDEMSRLGNEIRALLDTRVGAGKDLTALALIVMGLDEWRRTQKEGRKSGGTA